MDIKVKTLQRWDREGTLKANRTPIDRCYYTYDQYLQFKGINAKNDNRKYENLKKGEVTQRSNIQKHKLKVQKLHHKKDNIRMDYINKTIAEIVKTKPSYITIENLNVSVMMKNRHFSKAVASQKFYEFRTNLKAKCDEYI